MGNLKLDYSKTLDFISKNDILGYELQVKEQLDALYNKTGKGNDFLGWLNLPSSITFDELKDIQDTADGLKEKCEVVVVVGIGGSYLGSKAVIDALSDNFERVTTFF